ncbi:RagB/SusD family nutrient uptake outer membrane protein [Flavivirga jejuensis]|uniref:RagB/SusD family nutrient uptake outer membrane protein n=1 Tax=Flavivirga jejuensis TaxID=870487 RepID=A0ABT8WRU4_9FLAO|nr:RagB/SusD family nutrient uptake outer membrane protein [Flavivirga jejuensis]MDO5975626.1 RagB/SusD family nutrient uptake outer membrane protein [Flavivirga jejuensis]
MKKLFYIALMALIFGVCSCADNLDLTPDYELNEKNAITDKVKARAAVNGIYPFITQGSNFSGGLYGALASKAGFVDWSNGDFNMTTTQSNNSPSVQYKWLGYYETINAANFAISGISKLSEVKLDEEEKIALIAEARCLRAMAHAYVFWVYGHWWASDDSDAYGILYRDELATVTNLQKPRLNVGESYKKIYEDLDYAIANLGNFSTNRHVSKEFAKVLKAKIMLYRAGFDDKTTGLDEALTLVNEVLNSSIPGFSMQGDLAQVYKDSWDSEENLFSGYLEGNGDTNYRDSDSWYRQRILHNYSTRLPLDPGILPTAGLRRGADWFQADPRWDIVTGVSRDSYSWDIIERYAFTKVTRFGEYAGLRQTPPDNKYNTYFFRYPELYILKAELLARTGATVADAIAPINEMRSKRTNPVFPTPLNPTTKQELMDLIFKEYFLETFLENGSEFFASVRFKDGAGQLWAENLKEMTIEFNRLCYPIPSEEMETNKLMIQNPDLE